MKALENLALPEHLENTDFKNSQDSTLADTLSRFFVILKFSSNNSSHKKLIVILMTAM